MALNHFQVNSSSSYFRFWVCLWLLLFCVSHTSCTGLTVCYIIFVFSFSKMSFFLFFPFLKLRYNCHITYQFQVYKIMIYMWFLYQLYKYFKYFNLSICSCSIHNYAYKDFKLYLQGFLFFSIISCNTFGYSSHCLWLVMWTWHFGRNLTDSWLRATFKISINKSMKLHLSVY